MHIFLTGEIQIGKSTAAVRALEQIGVKPSGFRTYFGEDRHAPEHSLYLCNAWETRSLSSKQVIADFHLDRHPDFYRERFEPLALESLALAEGSPLIVMDECGWLEREAKGFQRRVLELLEEETPILGVVRQGGEGWLDEIRCHPNVRLITVTLDNRDELPAQLVQMLRRKIKMNTPVLFTERLCLRPFAPGDAPAVYEGWEQDPEVARYMFWQSHHDYKKTERWLQEELGKLTSDDWYRWAICHRMSGELLGTGLIYYEPEVAGWEIGYNLKRAAWGQGYTTEAMQRILRFAWEEMSITEVMGRYALANAASARVMAKLGFVELHPIKYPCNAGVVPGMLLCCRHNLR